MVAEEDTFRGDQGTSLIKVVCSYPMMKETMVTNHKNECLPHLFGNLQNRFSHFLQPAMCRQRHVEGCPLTTHWVEGVPINEDQWPEHVRWSCVLIPAATVGPSRCELEVMPGEKVLVRPSQLCGKGSDLDRDGWFEARCPCSDARASFWKHTTERALRTRLYYGVELPFCPLRSEMSIRDPTLQRRQTHRCWRPDVRVGISTIIHVKVMFVVSVNKVGARVSAWRGAGKALLSPLLWMG
jgi:hypothetical protein